MPNKVKRAKPLTRILPIEKSMAMCYAYQVGGIKGIKILYIFKDYSKTVIYWYCKKPLYRELKEDKRTGRGIDRRSKLSHADHWNIRKSIPELREKVGSSTSKRVQVLNGIEHVSNRTVQSAMNKVDYKYLRSRKKVILSKSDIAKVLQFRKNKSKKKIG